MTTKANNKKRGRQVPENLSEPLRIRVTRQSKKDAKEIAGAIGLSEAEVFRLAIPHGLKALRTKGKNPLIPSGAAQ